MKLVDRLNVGLNFFFRSWTFRIGSGTDSLADKNARKGLKVVKKNNIMVVLWFDSKLIIIFFNETEMILDIR